MPGIFDLLARQIDGQTIKKMSAQIGASEDQTQRAIMGALPLLLGALQRNAGGGAGGAESLFNALSRDHDGGILDDVAGFLGAGESGAGDKILSHVLGSRRAHVETGLSRMSGLDAWSITKLLPTLAPLVMGALGREQRTRGLDASGLTELLNGERADVESRQPDAMGIFGKLLDSDGDGNVMDDVARLGTSLLGGFLNGR